MIGLSGVIPISMILFGWRYINACPVAEIPDFLLKEGIIWAIMIVIYLLSPCMCSTNSGRYSILKWLANGAITFIFGTKFINGIVIQLSLMFAFIFNNSLLIN